MNIIKYILQGTLMLSLYSCSNKLAYGPDPYAGGKEPVDVVFTELAPRPSQAKPGGEVVFNVRGLLKYKDQIKFYINNIQAQVTNISDSSLTGIVPENCSTGGVKIVVDGQIFAGPTLPIIGKLAIDPTFQSGIGANSSIYSILKTSSNQVFIGGSFTDYNGNAASSKIAGIARITTNGEFVRGMQFGNGVTGVITSMSETANKDILIAGSISQYDTIKLVRNITTISSTGALPVKSTPILNLTSDPAKSNLIAPVFNGGTVSPIAKAFYQNNKVTIVGRFSHYSNNYYTRSTYDNILIDIFPMGGLARLETDGSLDDGYFVNKTTLPHKGFEGVNGVVNDAVLQDDGKLILVGAFSRFNNTQSANNIVRLKADGNFDADFQLGSGANGFINDIQYSKLTKKYIVTGGFTMFNGKPANGMALLNEDGSIDTGFQSLGFAAGSPNYAVQLTNGLILVTGSFGKYNDVIREGLMLIDTKGNLAKDYNNTGRLVGNIYDSLEGTNSLGQQTITLVGMIQSFNGKNNLGNIVRLTLLD
ncbi:DUF5008 domain-containing protein [Sphingobacterium sp.]|uniref:DUF5008 domain-containing protein n=1 Tax=Sphingobacterium sp. TaxID=341027 RepID=UPI00289BBDEE|nr:DUF5008 domain-containing protein [Sphingobacterium sp.]